jgi:hypothetical protein
VKRKREEREKSDCKSGVTSDNMYAPRRCLGVSAGSCRGLWLLQTALAAACRLLRVDSETIYASAGTTRQRMNVSLLGWMEGAHPYMLFDLLRSHHVALSRRISWHRLPHTLRRRGSSVHHRPHSVWTRAVRPHAVGRGRSAARVPHALAGRVAWRVTSSSRKSVLAWRTAKFIHS